MLILQIRWIKYVPKIWVTNCQLIEFYSKIDLYTLKYVTNLRIFDRMISDFASIRAFNLFQLI